MSAEDDLPADDRTRIDPRTATAGVPTTRPAGPPPMQSTIAPAHGRAADGDHGNALPVGTFLGEFEITSTLGEGGFGIVYLATDHSLQRQVAVKEYMPSSLAARVAGGNVQVKSERHRETFEAGRKSFVNEARLLAQFDHPALLKVYRFWEGNGTAYMVMPFYEGRTLKDVLRRRETPPDEEWLRTLLGPLTEALVVIHREQCFHRDIAPDNVLMLAGSNRPLLLDFGAARRVIGDMTQALTVILKPGYAPIEQYDEIPGMKQGPWTDVYALAAVVHFAIMGRTPPTSVARLIGDTYVPLVQSAAGRYSADFLAAIDRALAVRPEHRTPSVARLRAELGLDLITVSDAYVTKPLMPGDVPPRPAPPPPPPAPPVDVPVEAPVAAPPAVPATPPRSRAGLAVAALAIVGLGLGGWLMFGRTPAPGVTPPVAVAPAAAPSPAPAPPVASPPAPVVPTTLDPVAEFERVVAGQGAGWDVRITAARTTLRIGRDELAFDVTAARDGLLTVLAYGADGALVQLLPNGKSGPVRLRAGQRFRFPTGNGFVLAISEPPGPGQLLAIVSPVARDFAALKPRREGPVDLLLSGAAGADALRAHAGSQPLLAGRGVCAATPCDDAYGAALLKVEAVR